MRADVALPGGLSGHSVRGLADTVAPAPGVAEAAAHVPPGAGGDPATAASIGDTVRAAAEEIVRGLDLAGRALGESVNTASDMAFARAAEVAPAGAGAASGLGQTAFSWSGYVQAVGILCLLLAALWLVLWLVRRYGRFNFLPRPGALPRGALVMEAQMPLGPRKGLMVVRFLNTRLLLGVTEQQICLLKEEDVHDEPRDNDFQGIMDQARRGVADSGGPAGPAA
ncbi:flagellar biosynthetic protein FliO [uncultured Desulfovibrio sp.]|uniref:flagellar biosynthetic protein FliO n=1 Tax=uncultured Desulfovibrio sp. TaxID=167968 RepID=UPI00280500CF|nr:flagellar biosynthetic protein FliO [uncultured Desulfovibrio sp.]